MQVIGLSYGRIETKPAGDKESFSPAEDLVREIVAGVLELDRTSVGRNDHFFALGGSSLQLAQVIAALRDRTGQEIPLYEVFKAPTVAGLASWLGVNSDEASPRPPLVHVPYTTPELLSPAQERMWFLHGMDASGAAYNVVVAFRLTGTLNLPALQRALSMVVGRHEALRTTFVLLNGEVRQVVHPNQQVEILLRNIAACSAREVQEILEADARLPFDLEQGPLARAVLLKSGDAESVLQLTLHHIICDAWSLSVLMREVAHYYNAFVKGCEPDLPLPTLQYRDIVRAIREATGTARHREQRDYWKDRLEGIHDIDLPSDRARPAVRTSAGAVFEGEIERELAGRLRSLAAGADTTLYTVLLSGFISFLHRYTGQIDLTLISPVAGRTITGSESLIGLFINSVLLRAQVESEMSFRFLVRQVNDVVLGATIHQEVPFAEVVAAVRAADGDQNTPLARVQFNLINVPFDVPAFEGLNLSPVSVDRKAAQFDLSCTVTETGGYLRLSLEYSTDLFNEETVRRMFRHYVAILEAVSRDPEVQIGAATFLSETEREQLVNTWNETTTALPDVECLYEWFEKVASAYPDAIAVQDAETSLTYRELLRRSNALALRLQEKGVGPEVVVALCTDRNVGMVVGMLGILRAGGCYLPIDPLFPEHRIRYLLTDANVRVIVTQRHLTDLFPYGDIEVVFAGDGEVATDPVRESGATATNLAYLMYTSGTTGSPKGVQIEHGNVVNFIAAMQDRPGIGPDDRVLGLTTVTFDIHVFEVFLPLLSGARLVIVPRSDVANPYRLAEHIREYGITLIQATPATWRLLLEAGWQGGSSVRMLCGGDVMPQDLAERLLTGGGELWNMYGPTETTVWSTVGLIKYADRITVGRPVANTTIYILDERLQPVPIGVTGMLYIGGHGVARGYLNRPDLDRNSFLPDPFRPGERMYRTGDLARYRSDGEIEIRGRADLQLKIRGFRIEPGEVEAALMEHPSVRSAVVVAAGDQGDALAAFVVADPEADVTPAGLAAFLRENLPSFSVPAYYAFLDALPLTNSGKVDRQALPHPALIRVEAPSHYEPPRSELEKELVALFASVLKVDRIGIHDDFYDLGGHSLLAMALYAAIQERYGRTVTMAALMNHPTVAGVAGLLSSEAPATRKYVVYNATGKKPPIFGVPAWFGGSLHFRLIAQHLGSDQPVYEFPGQGLDGSAITHRSIQDMAADYVDDILRFGGAGPFHLMGYCAGGYVCLEIAQELKRRGKEVATLAIIDLVAPGYLADVQREIKARSGRIGIRTTRLMNALRTGPAYTWARIRHRVALHLDKWRRHREYLRVAALARDGHRVPVEQRHDYISTTYALLAGAYRPGVYEGELIIFRMAPVHDLEPDLGWKAHASSVATCDVPGDHMDAVYEEEPARIVAGFLKGRLSNAAPSVGQP